MAQKKWITGVVAGSAVTVLVIDVPALGFAGEPGVALLRVVAQRCSSLPAPRRPG